MGCSLLGVCRWPCTWLSPRGRVGACLCVKSAQELTAHEAGRRGSPWYFNWEQKGLKGQQSVHAVMAVTDWLVTVAGTHRCFLLHQHPVFELSD